MFQFHLKIPFIQIKTSGFTVPLEDLAWCSPYNLPIYKAQSCVQSVNICLLEKCIH